MRRIDEKEKKIVIIRKKNRGIVYFYFGNYLFLKNIFPGRVAFNLYFTYFNIRNFAGFDNQGFL